MFKKIISSLLITAMVLLMAIPAITVTAQEPLPIRVNAGGNSFTDGAGNLWQADGGFSTGETYQSSAAISGTTDDYLYQTERWDEGAAPELSYTFDVQNGEYDVKLHFAEIYTGAFSVGARVFDVQLEGSTVLDNFDIFSEVGGNTADIKQFTTTVADGNIQIVFGHVVENPKVSAIEIIKKEVPGEGHLAHAVAGADQTVFDLNSNGSEQIQFDGSSSHTHAFGANLNSYIWKESNTQIGTGATPLLTLSVGVHTITLTVTDNLGNTASDDIVITVQSASAATGLSGYYYDFTGTSLTQLPNVSSLKPSFGKTEGNLAYDITGGQFAGTPYSDSFASKYVGFVKIPAAGSYTFGIESNDGSKLYINNTLLVNNDGQHGMQKKQGTVSLSAGKHAITIEFFEGVNNAGLKLYWTKPGSSEEIIPASELSHNIADELPVLHSVSPTEGITTGGNKVTLSGYGFVYPSSQTTVHFGSTNLTGNQITIVNANTLEFLAPAGTPSTIQVTVETPKGISNQKGYTYSETALPAITFAKSTLFTGIDGPTTIAFGPDNKLYVGTQFGEVWVLTLNDSLQVTNSITSTAISNNETTFRSILGIAFNPLDDPANPKVYVSHSNLFHGESQNVYTGKVSTLSGPNLSTKTDVVTGLPVSDHDHGINGLEFGLSGEMYINIGGLTNAGVAGELSSTGLLDEKLFSAATLVANVNKQNFSGAITYDAEGNQTGGFDVKVYSSGLRNPYDLALHSNGILYATDNGPNFGYGDKSVTCATSGADPEEGDELNALVENGYYGHANRKRGATDSRQCKWRSVSEASDSQYTKPLTMFPASTNGLAEYTTNNFAGQLKGHLLAGQWGGNLYDVTLSGNGSTVTKNEVLTPDGGLDVLVHATGAILIAQNEEDQIIVHKPIETSPSGLYINGISQNRGPLSGGRSITVYGNGFTSTTTVSIGGNSCAKTNTTATKITCTTPSSSTTGFKDVVVSEGTTIKTLTKGYMYMGGASVPSTGWTTKSQLPVSLGEVTSASVNGAIYVFGGHNIASVNNTATYKYTPSSNSWTALAPWTGSAHHSTAQVINGKIYVFGGYVGSSESAKMFVYDPVANTWIQKATLKKNNVDFTLGSPASGVINGKMYVAGGINNGITVKNTFVYDPATDIWTELSEMPEGRNHAAGIGDNGKLYIFGGRCCGGNAPGQGFTSTYIYNASTNAWSTGSPMPTGRGGMANAVLLNGQYVVIGGEGAGPFNGTFKKVESYNPTTNSWNTLPDMPTGRHGMYPVVLDGNVYVIAGGTAEGHSVSNIHEVYVSGVVVTPTPSPSPTPSPTPGIQNPVRIHVGGGTFTDSLGNSWIADTYFNTGSTFSVGNAILNTTDDPIYQTERYDAEGGAELQYTIPVQNGNYKVVLHFAEIYNGAFANGARVFDVTAEGQLKLDNVDIYQEVGPYAALKKEFTQSVIDGNMNIQFIHQVENPKVAGIEIIPL